METNLHLDKKTEISSPIKEAISSHIEKFYTPRARQNSNMISSSVNNRSSDNTGSFANIESEAHAPVGLDNPFFGKV